ncbi:MAG: flagellar hook-basal body protein [Clostridia bacterium]|nr:flagellar hook-basal body protein [Clostridia bacterium]
MISAFYSGAAAMRAQQTAVDITANNLANVNTTGYKQKQAQFSDLLYSSMASTANTAGQAIGSGTAVTSVENDMTEGNISETDRPLDYCIPGSGFFQVRDSSGNRYFTRDGSFEALRSGSGYILGDSQGRAVLDSSGNTIALGKNSAPEKSPGVFTFSNEQALSATGGNLYAQTTQSGAPRASGTKPIQGGLEGSNTDLAQQMAGLMISQRGFELSSKAVQTADSIEEMANQLR